LLRAGVIWRQGFRALSSFFVGTEGGRCVRRGAPSCEFLSFLFTLGYSLLVAKEELGSCPVAVFRKMLGDRERERGDEVRGGRGREGREKRLRKLSFVRVSKKRLGMEERRRAGFGEEEGRSSQKSRVQFRVSFSGGTDRSWRSGTRFLPGRASWTCSYRTRTVPSWFDWKVGKGRGLHRVCNRWDEPDLTARLGRLYGVAC
jgi:hypothetical protein